MIPSAVLAGTILAFVTIGQITAAPLYVSLPNGMVIAFVMAGLAVACMSTDASDAPADDPPPGDDDTPVLGSPSGPWTVVAHLGSGAPPVVLTADARPVVLDEHLGDASAAEARG